MILRGQNIVFISIHAPPRGATPYARCIRASRDISIHAPPRGATATAASTETPSRFQFTPLREGRRLKLAVTINCFNFNSRPSARGDVIHLLTEYNTLFQFTPLREGRHAQFASLRHALLFQFTPLREGRLATLPKWTIFQNFNSRPSARGDGIRRGSRSASWDISIHAPPRGATGLESVYNDHVCKFQFTPLREGRLSVMLATMYNFISIHAPPRGATAMLNM